MNFPKIFFISIAIIFITAGVSFGQCPSITVSGPTGMTNRDETMKFRAGVSAVGSRLDFWWTISSGTIMAGQRTSEITVKPDADTTIINLTATVVIEGLPSDCEKSASESAPIFDVPTWCWTLDEYGPVKPNDERARLDTFFAELSNNPTNIGFIVLRITKSERRDRGNARIQFILKHAKFRKFDRTPLWFALELAEEQRTIPVRFPPGGVIPPCNNCLIIKGGDL